VFHNCLLYISLSLCILLSIYLFTLTYIFITVYNTIYLVSLTYIYIYQYIYIWKIAFKPGLSHYHNQKQKMSLWYVRLNNFILEICQWHIWLLEICKWHIWLLELWLLHNSRNMLMWFCIILSRLICQKLCFREY
jgi:hypothetical protein